MFEVCLGLIKTLCIGVHRDRLYDRGGRGAEDEAARGRERRRGLLGGGEEGGEGGGEGGEGRGGGGREGGKGGGGGRREGGRGTAGRLAREASMPRRAAHTGLGGRPGRPSHLR